jgi:hypothetical protein
MNDYIQLYVNGQTAYKYRLPFASWKPVVMKIGTVRITLLGTLDAAYAAADIKEWNGKIRCDVAPASGFGTPENLMATLAHKGAIIFVDNDNVSHTVHATGQISESSITPAWSGNSNTIDIQVKMTEVVN